MNNYTHTIFKSEKCDFSTVSDHRRVICKKHINIGDVLLVEHCYSQRIDDENILVNSLRFDGDLYDNLSKNYQMGGVICDF